jgi:hypothetical protein
MLNFEYSRYESLVDISSITIDIQLEAWKNILGLSSISLDEYFCNPRRTTKLDRNPGCRLQNINGVVLLSDYGDDYWNTKSIFQAVKREYNIEFKEALQKIYYELISNNTRLNSKSTGFIQKQAPQFKFEIIVENRGWRKWDRQYYGHGDITRQQLEFEECYPISKYWTNSKFQPKTFNGHLCNKRDPGYSYRLGDNIKMRFPKRLKNQGKWISNIKKDQIGGRIEIINNPGELRTIIVTKSLRDYLVIHNCGFNCRYLPNETVHLGKEFINWLYTNFDVIIFLMDNDAQGLAANNRIKSQWKNQIKDKPILATSLPIHYLIEQITDPFDLVKHPSYNINTLSQELELIYEQALENIYEFEKNMI